MWFDGHFGGPRFLRADDDSIEMEKLEVVSADSVLWAIEVDGEAPNCRTGRIDSSTVANVRYPVRYGELRRCFKEIVAPQLLPIGQKLIIRAHDFNNGFGEFSVQKQIVLFPVSGDPFEGSVTQEWPTAWPLELGLALPIENATGR